MEKAYSTITKILIVCIVITIVCTVFRIKTLDSLKETTEKLGNNIETIREENEEIGDVEGYAIILNGLALGAGVFATAAFWILILGIGFIIVVIFTVGIIFMQVCKVLETSIDPEKWKKVTSKILFILYVVAHSFVAIFDVLFIEYFIVDAIVIILALAYNLYIYIKARKEEEKVLASDVKSVDESKIEIIDEKTDDKNK